MKVITIMTTAMMKEADVDKNNKIYYEGQR